MDNSTIRISVIIPNYNHGMYIKQCLSSVMDSDFDSDKMEIIVVDDASNDKSVAIIESIMPESSIAIKLLQNDTNIGAARSRNRGIVNAKGTFVYFLDADDYLHKQCLRRHFDFLSQHPDFIACYAPQQEFLNSSGELLNLRSNKPFDYFDLLKGPYISSVALFRTKELLSAGMLNINMPPYGWIDYELWLRLGKIGKKVHFLKGEPLYYYRQHDNSITKGIDFNKMKSLIDFLHIEHPLEFDIQKGQYGEIEYISSIKEAQLFLTGSEEDSIKVRITQETQHFEFRISPPRKIKTLRFDPINDFATVKINSSQLSFEGQSYNQTFKITSNAAVTENDQLFFDTTDPQVYFELPDFALVDAVSITIHYLKTGSDAIFDIQKNQKLELETTKQQADELAENVKTRTQQIDGLIEERNKNYQLYLETLSNYSRIMANPAIRAMVKIFGFFDSFSQSGYLAKAIRKIDMINQSGLLRKSELFDPQYYLSVYPDVAGTNISPEIHFLKYGWKEGRNPSAGFDTAFYVANNPDVLAIRQNPLVHYIKKGQFEGRNIKPVKDRSEEQFQYIRSRKHIFGLINPKRNRKILVKPHLSFPVDDFALETPFKFGMPLFKPQPSIAVMCHIFYEDLTDEVKAYLNNIPYNFDLYITTDTEEKKATISDKFNQWDKGKVTVEIFENRGRDIAPKLLAWKKIYAKYEFFLHIHTKKSLHHNSSQLWRTYLFNNLIGSEKIVKSIFEAFYSDPLLGMIGVQHFLNIRSFTGWGYNFEIAKLFATRAGIDLKINGRIDFPSGSMFWGRSAAIMPILENIKISDFEKESNQVDGTFAHAIERLYYFSCEKAGFKWIKVFDPKTANLHQRTLTVIGREELPQIIGHIQTPLMDENGKAIVLQNSDAAERLYFLKIQSKSPYKDWPVEIFYEQLKLHIEGKESLIDFDEAFYLAANKDIKQYINVGTVECGFVHYCLNGQYEKRLWSSKRLFNKFKLKSNYPDGLFEPLHIQKEFEFKAQKLGLPKSPNPFIMIFVSDLQKELFFAGYQSFFNDFRPVFMRFNKIVIAVAGKNFDSDIVKNYSDHIEVIHQSQISQLQFSPDVIVGYNHFETLKAIWIFDKPEKVVYYCQDYEPGFFPFGTNHIEAESAIAKSKNIILSTELLRNFLEQEGLIRQNNVFVTSPEIEILKVDPEKTKKLFFYFRPEYFHTRNIPEILWEAVHEFCDRHTGYELYLVGAIETRFSITLNGNEVYVLSKLPKEDYYELLASCDVAVAMIYSAHPGVIAFQAAASGIPTITNIFKNRDVNTLKAISENIIPFDPVRETLCEKVEEALSMTKGNKHFNTELYAGPPQPVSFADFILHIMNR
jgi:glycosyltransferase involved in cell wall biosynthesis